MSSENVKKSQVAKAEMKKYREDEMKSLTNVNKSQYNTYYIYERKKVRVC